MKLTAFEFGAGNEIRTRDPNLGKVVLYQLSYSRSEPIIVSTHGVVSRLKRLFQLLFPTITGQAARM